MPPIGLCELVLIVADVQTSARFYHDVVGLTPETEPTDTWAWFLCGRPGLRQRLALRKGPLLFEEHSPHPPGRRFGPAHFALEAPRAELQAMIDRVRLAGALVHGPVRLEWMRADSVYFHDPDGNLLEFWSPDP